MEIVKSAKNTCSAGNFTVFFIVIVVFLLSFISVPRNAIFSYRWTPEKLVEKDDLDTVLQQAAASAAINKTVIVAVVNKAYVETERDDPVNMLDVFLESFWVGEGTRPLIKNLLIVATDQTAYERCVFRGLHCYLLAKKSDGSDLAEEKVFMSPGFIDMMWRRTLFLLTLLQKGYNFIFTDTDVMWLRNPFTRLSNATTEDIQFSTDRFNGNPRSPGNPINTGFYFARSNSRTISLFERWYNMKNRSGGMKEQDVLQGLINQGALKELNVTALFLETRYFSGFCQDSKEFDKVVTVHANCCRYISAKVKDLTQVLKDWKRFKGLPKNESSLMEWSRHNNCGMSWHRNNG